MKGQTSQLLFAAIFTLGCSMFELVIFEIVGILDIKYLSIALSLAYSFIVTVLAGLIGASIYMQCFYSLLFSFPVINSISFSLVMVRPPISVILLKGNTHKNYSSIFTQETGSTRVHLYVVFLVWVLEDWRFLPNS